MTSLADRFNAVCDKHLSENTRDGTNCCKNEVVLHHKDTLGYPLPAGIVVNVYDETGKVHRGVIDENGVSRHGVGPVDPTGGNPQVHCGEISWQLLREPGTSPVISPHTNKKIERIQRQLADKDETIIHYPSDGYVLIKAKARDEKNSVPSPNPKYQLSNPLTIEAHWQNGGYECHIDATYLPPPLTLNLRFNQQATSDVNNEGINKLIRQINADGKVATLFIHGYNVSLGKTGNFPTFEDVNDTRSVNRNSPKVPYMFPMDSDSIQRPWLHYTDTELTTLAKTELSQSLRHSNDLDNPHMAFIYKNIDARFNGKNALSWFPHLEYYLNLAASGKQNPDVNLTAEDWEKYSRIVGVTWSGSVSPSFVFTRAELYANEAGRELAKVLKLLIEAQIQINIITHSLGARVALAALNILGDFDGKYNEKIDNLIMWEAAVADNAVTDTYTRAKNPVAMELFPFAHKVVKRIRALYSEEDGVLGADSYLDFDDGFSDLGRGAYPKKYSSLGNNTNALIDYYPIKLKEPNVIRELYGIVSNVKSECKVHQVYSGRSRCSEIPNIPFRNQIKTDIRAALEEEAERTANSLDEPLIYLKPWSHYRRFKKGDAYFEHIIDVLMGALFDDWRVYETEVRPALGHQGNRLTAPNPEQIDEALQKAQKMYPADGFIEKLKDDKFWFWDQSNYFITHSAMRDFEFKVFDKNGFFADIYKESYKLQIMDNWIKRDSKFGRY